MKHVIHILSVVVFGLASLFAMPASALTLGRMQGGAWIGQPLSLVVGVQASADAPDLTCYRVKVRYGDMDLRANQITLDYVSSGSGQPQGAGSAPLLRIRTTATVNEPTVTVQVDSVCAQRVSRTYVLLSEWSGETASAVSDGLKPATDVAAVSTAAPANARGNDTQTTPPDVAAPKTPVAAQAVAPAVKVARSNARLHLSAGGGGSGGSGALNSAVLDSLGKRIDAIAQRQDTLEAADNSLQTQAHIDILSGQLLAVQQLTVKNQQSLITLAALVDRSASGLTANGFLWGIGFLMLLVLVALIWFYLQLRKAEKQGTSWWTREANASNAASVPVFSEVKKAPIPSPPSPLQANTVTASTEFQTMPVVDVNASTHGKFQGSETVSGSLEKPSGKSSRHITTRLERRDFAHSAPNSLRFINTKEMLDVRQQADFFVALGQHERAIKVLQNSIASGDGANPLVYLDLLGLHKGQGAVAQFEQLREEFNAQFTGLVPSFDRFGEDGADLESYADVCEELVAVWGQPEAIDLIEMCLVRVPDDGATEDLTFDLNAFRELLLLHSVLKRHDEAQDSDLIPFSASRMHVGTTATPSGLGAPSPAATPVPTLVQPMTVQAVDLDLGDFDTQTSQSGMLDFDLSSYEKALNKKPTA